MRYALTLLAVSPTLIGSARGSPDIPTHGGGTKVWMGLTAPPVYGVDPSWEGTAGVRPRPAGDLQRPHRFGAFTHAVPNPGLGLDG
jgi:hypothetical protein